MNIDKILISSDLLRPIIVNNNIEYFHFKRLDKYYNFLKYQLSSATNLLVEKFSFDNTDFSMFTFYELCGLKLEGVDDWYKIYDLENIPQSAVDYYEKYIKNSLVIYHEPSKIIKKIHNILDIPYIEQTIHPIRYMDDNFWGFSTNCGEIFNQIRKYQIDEELFYIYANSIKAFAGQDPLDIEENSLLLAGQTNSDKALFDGSKMLSIFDYEDEIIELSKKYEKIYYKPHPYNFDLEKTEEFLSQFASIEIVDENIYKLLSHKNIAKVCAITSGVLYEAKYFEKDVQYLHKPYLTFDYNKNCEFNEDTYLSIYNEFVKPVFWKEILKNVLSVKNECKDFPVNIRPNFVRNSFSDFWAQSELDSSVVMSRNILEPQITKAKNDSWYACNEIEKLKKKNKKTTFKDLCKKISIRGFKNEPIIKKYNIFSSEAIEKLLSDYNFQTVLDIGCGEGIHSDIFLDNKKNVTAIDYGESVYFKNNKNKIATIIADFNTYEFKQKYDCVWCSHVLEHQVNPNSFLSKIHSLLNDGGVLAVTVPPSKSDIVGGHVVMWNAGILLYNLVLAGFDCSKAKIKMYDYNVSIIVKKGKKINIENLEFDAGDISKIKKYLPKKINFRKNEHDIYFDGVIKELNWD